MIDDDLRTLNDRNIRRSLDGLERDIWAGVEARVMANRQSRLIISAQAAVFAIGIVTSAAAGMHFAAGQDSPSTLNVFSTRADLAPAFRLLGR
jgi:hypothetical protein